MGAVADSALAAGASVIGVLPGILSDSEIAHSGLTRLELVDTMHQRKARMAELADAFLVLPGGYGTLEELLEIATWAQLRLHAKPIVLINTANYWDGFLAFLDSAVAAGFLKPQNRALLCAATCQARRPRTGRKPKSQPSLSSPSPSQLLPQRCTRDTGRHDADIPTNKFRSSDHPAS